MSFVTLFGYISCMSHTYHISTNYLVNAKWSWQRLAWFIGESAALL